MDDSKRAEIRAVLDARLESLEHAARGSVAVRNQALRDLEDAGRSELRVRQDYVGRYAIELLQNAHDACADVSVEGLAWIAVTPTALLIGNEGAAFDADRIASLTRLGASTKDPGDRLHHTVGYKGIGFSAVFEITDTPQVIGSDADLRFGFDRERALREVERTLGKTPAAVSARAFPFELKSSEWSEDSAAVERILGSGATTVIRCPFRRGTDPQRIGEDVRSQLVPEVLLFMDALVGLDVEILGDREATTRRIAAEVGRGRRIDLVSSASTRSWLLSSGSVSAPLDAVAALDDEMWRNVRELNCAVALPWGDDGPDPSREPAPIHVYFPTSDRHGRSFLVHGDFYVTSNRRHIETEGPGGEISRAVAHGAAELLAELATECRDHGRALLECLSLRGTTSGFGEVITEYLVDACRSAPILRDAHHLHPITPSAALRIPILDEQGSRVVLAACLPPLSVVAPEDDLGGATDFLDELRVPVVDGPQVADNLDPRAAGFDYDDVLVAISQWRFGVGTAAGQNGVQQALMGRPIIQNERGSWCEPTTVRRLSADVGEMPAWMVKPTLKMPTREPALRLIEALPIRSADLAALLSEIGSRYSNGPALDSEEARATIEFLVSAWVAARPVVQERLKWAAEQVRVPANRARSSDSAWIPGGKVYFGADWTNDGLLEDVYGPFGAHEFLAFEPGVPIGRDIPDRAFFEFLGVASSPRISSRTVGDDAAEVRLLKTDPRFNSLSCGHEPHRTQKHRYTITEMDRLDRLVQRALDDPSQLLRLLASHDRPFGAETAIECSHSYHQDARPRSATLPYMRALVDSQAWVPVLNDANERDRLPPWKVWTGIGSARARLRLPTTASTGDEAAQLGFVNADQPSSMDLSVALTDISMHYGSLAEAPDEVITTADWLLQELDRALHRDSLLLPSFKRAPAFPAFVGSHRSWQSAPVVVDLPGLDQLPALPALPDGRWPALARAFRLEFASDVVSPRVITARPVESVHRLSDDLRNSLVAGLHSQGVALRTAANRVANLSETVVESLEIEVSYSGVHRTVRVPFFLDVVRGRARQIVRAELFRTAAASLDDPAIARDLELYLESTDTVIHQLLNQASKWLEVWCVGDAEIAEAAGALASARRSHVDSQVEVVARSDGTESSQSPTGMTSQGTPSTGVDVQRRAEEGSAERQPAAGRERAGGEERTSEVSHLPPSRRAGKPTEPARVTRSPQKRPRRLVSYAEVLPEAADAPDPERREAIEAVDRAGIALVLAYEKARGRVPDEQDHGNPGFDIISADGEGLVRFIEVKSMSDEWEGGAVALTRRQVEENRARGEAFWLYVVEGASDPKTARVLPIQDPVGRLDRLAFADDWRIAVSED